MSHDKDAAQNWLSGTHLRIRGEFAFFCEHQYGRLMVHVTMKNSSVFQQIQPFTVQVHFSNLLHICTISVELFLCPLSLIPPDFLLFSWGKVLHKLDQPPVKAIFSKYLKEWKNISNACITYLWNISISSLATLPTNSAREEKLNAGGSRRECPS